ncbi:MAG: hypothetical protein LIR46_01355 [Bacteroidota bacterium]|nr:hypothetical protein [Bacteroidota bacterium]
MTKREMFAAIRERVADNAEMVEFIDHEVELLSRKRSSAKPTKTQIANAGIKEQILTVLSADGMTATEVLHALGNDEFKVQKISALLRQLVLEGKVVKDIVGKVSYFTLAE